MDAQLQSCFVPSKSNYNSFKRMLSTNYKYSCLVSLTLNLVRNNKVHQITNTLAGKNSISSQKNYAIVALRLAFLIYNCGLERKQQVVQNIFWYFQKYYEQCISIKFKQCHKYFLNEIKAKCLSDIDTFKKLVLLPELNLTDAKNLLLNLYREEGENTTPKQNQQAQKLAKIFIGVIKFGKDYKLTTSSENQKIQEMEIKHQEQLENNVSSENKNQMTQNKKYTVKKSKSIIQTRRMIIEDLKSKQKQNKKLLGSEEHRKFLGLEEENKLISREEKHEKQFYFDDANLDDLIDMKEIQRFVEESFSKVQLQDLILFESEMTLNSLAEQVVKDN